MTWAQAFAAGCLLWRVTLDMRGAQKAQPFGHPLGGMVCVLPDSGLDVFNSFDDKARVLPSLGEHSELKPILGVLHADASGDE